MQRRAATGIGASLIFLLFGTAVPARAQSEGFFADFATSHGTFTVWLDHERAPLAVASFVGLATGAGSWLDPRGNVWTNRRFYDGSLFHRVVKDANTNGIAIQGGGTPAFSLGDSREPQAGATNLYAAVLTTTNAVGISTSVLVQAVLTTNAPAVATNYVTGGVPITTNAPKVTLVTLLTSAVSSNAAGPPVTNTSVRQAGYTNFTLTEVVTTNYSVTAVIITNHSSSNLVTTHALHLVEEQNRSCLLRVQTTNFANAGYLMPDAANNGLLHSNGVISMANSGPGTDSSQFFITTTNVPMWDGGYTVFGHVTTGMNVVTSIAAVAVQGAGERPVGDIVLSHVAIRRVGAAAEAFNIATQGVPVAETGFMRAGTRGTDLELAVELVPQSRTRFRDSTNLASWSSDDWGLYTNPATVITGVVPRATLAPATFFHAARIRYPLPITSFRSQRGRTFSFNWTSPALRYDVTFATNAAQPGTGWVWQGTNPPAARTIFVGDAWSREAYSGSLYFFDDLAREYVYDLGFQPGQTTNRFTGYWKNFNQSQRYPISGTFTTTP